MGTGTGPVFLALISCLILAALLSGGGCSACGGNESEAEAEPGFNGPSHSAGLPDAEDGFLDGGLDAESATDLGEEPSGTYDRLDPFDFPNDTYGSAEFYYELVLIPDTAEFDHIDAFECGEIVMCYCDDGEPYEENPVVAIMAHYRGNQTSSSDAWDKGFLPPLVNVPGVSPYWDLPQGMAIEDTLATQARADNCMDAL